MAEWFAPYKLQLRDPQNPPLEDIDQLRDKLPGVTITVDQESGEVVFAEDEPDLRTRVQAAVEDVWGAPAWDKHFYLAPGDPGVPPS